MSNHTLTPWTICPNDNSDILDSQGELIATAYPMGDSKESDDANAEFIVRACNAHDDLVASLNRTWEIIEMAGLTNLMNGVQLGQMSWYQKAENAKSMSYAALAKAKVIQ